MPNFKSGFLTFKCWPSQILAFNYCCLKKLITPEEKIAIGLLHRMCINFKEYSIWLWNHFTNLVGNPVNDVYTCWNTTIVFKQYALIHVYTYFIFNNIEIITIYFRKQQNILTTKPILLFLMPLTRFLMEMQFFFVSILGFILDSNLFFGLDIIC